VDGDLPAPPVNDCWVIPGICGTKCTAKCSHDNPEDGGGSVDKYIICYAADGGSGAIARQQL